jgi:16S rRNA processing protein RimM
MELLATGRVAGCHGLRGYLKVLSFSGSTEHFLRLQKVTLRLCDGEMEFTVEDVKTHGQGLLLKLKGVDEVEQCAKLRGAEIWVERTLACALGDGEYYVADLCRCRVFQRGRELGRVVAVSEGGAVEFLEVERPEGSRLIVPLSERFVGPIDVQAGRIELREEYEPT